MVVTEVCVNLEKKKKNILCVFSGENLVSESQSQGEETDQEEARSV